MTYNQWDTVVVPFPFTDIAGAKSRPTVVISSARFNAEHGQSILAMITTARAGGWPTDHSIVDLATAGLRHDSVIRWKIFTLDNRIIQARIGHLAASDVRACERSLREVLGQR